MTTKKKTLLSVVCVTWSMWTPVGLFKTLSFFVTLLHHGLSQRPISKKCSLRYVQSRTFRDSLFLALNQRTLFSYILKCMLSRMRSKFYMYGSCKSLVCYFFRYYMGLKIKLVKTTGPSFLTSFRSHCGSVSPCITMCDLILTGNLNLPVHTSL